MNYKVLIKKCVDPQRASAVAAEVARWSGSTPDVVYNAITQKAICIRKEADEEEANRLHAQFGAIGAEVELVPLSDGAAVIPPPVAAAAPAAAAGFAAPAPSAAPAPAAAQPARNVDVDDDDEDEEDGRVLSDSEYAEMCKQRGDIFHIEKESRLRNIELICMILAVAAGIFLSTREMIEIAADFFEKLPEERGAKILTEAVKEPEKEPEPEPEKPVERDTDKQSLKKSESKAKSQASGGGDPKQRVVKQGLLGMVSGDIKGRAVANADMFAKGGFAEGIDAILQGPNQGLRAGGDGGVGRAGAGGIGFGSGSGSGYGGGSGGIGDLMSSFSAPSNVQLKKVGNLQVKEPSGMSGASLTGGRSRASINRVVMQNMPALRHAYNRRLREKPGLAGRVTVKFAIDEFGKVMFAQLVSSTMSDSEFEQVVLERVRSWQFEKIDKPGDVTEVTYPFVFTQ